MSGCKILIKDVYARPLGNQIMYWRINSRGLGRASLEWSVVDVGRNLGATLYREHHPAAIVAMRKLQQPQRTVAMNDVNAHMLEHFMEWGWVQSY